MKYSKESVVDSGSFSKVLRCPNHNLPLRAWSRIGKLECPHRACIYWQPHPCDKASSFCSCDLQHDLDLSQEF